MSEEKAQARYSCCGNPGQRGLAPVRRPGQGGHTRPCTGAPEAGWAHGASTMDAKNRQPPQRHPGVLVNHQQRRRVRGGLGSQGCGTRSRCCDQSPRASCRPGPRQDPSAAPRRGCPPVSAVSRESAARQRRWTLPAAALAAGLTLCSAGAGSGAASASTRSPCKGTG